MPGTRFLLALGGKEFSALKGRDLREAVGTLRSTARKRAARLEQGGYQTQALTYLERSGGLPTIKGMSEAELRREFIRYRDFLNSQTSTVTGFKEFRSDVIEGLRQKGIDINNEDFQKFFDVYERLKEASPDIENRRLKYKSMRELANLIQDGKLDFEEMILQMQDELSELYEEEEIEEDGVSSFF